MELFHLRSPNSIQHQQDDRITTHQPHYSNQMAHQARQAHGSWHAQPDSAFSSQTTDESSVSSFIRPLHSRIVHPAHPLPAFQYSEPYPNGPTNRRKVASNSTGEPTGAAAIAEAEVDVTKRIADLHLTQLERELDSLMPTILNKLEAGKSADGERSAQIDVTPISAHAPSTPEITHRQTNPFNPSTSLQSGEASSHPSHPRVNDNLSRFSADPSSRPIGFLSRADRERINYNRNGAQSRGEKVPDLSYAASSQFSPGAQFDLDPDVVLVDSLIHDGEDEYDHQSRA